MTLELNAPASPRSLVITTIAARRAGRSSNSGCASLPATPDSSDTTRASAAEYGRAAMIASCARRSLAAATSFIARVILRVFLTLWMRLRMAFSDGTLVRLLALERELLGELGERVAQPLLDVALELAGRPELVEHVLLARLHVRQ